MTERDVIGMIASGAQSTPTKAPLRETAKVVASIQSKDFIGVWYKKDGSNGVETFDAHDKLDDWYGKLGDNQIEYSYVAAFDRTDSGTWPEPYNEFGAAVLTAVVTAQPPKEGKGSVWGWVLGFGAAFGGLILLKGKRK